MKVMKRVVLELSEREMVFDQNGLKGKTHSEQFASEVPFKEKTGFSFSASADFSSFPFTDSSSHASSSSAVSSPVSSPSISSLQVVAAVIFKGRKIFAARRKENLSNGGLWEFPGGKLEKGETAPLALVRELQEELGFRAKVGKKLLSVCTPLEKERFLNLHVYAVKVMEERPLFLEAHDSFKWMDIKELSGLDFCPADKEVCRFLQEAFLSLTFPESAF